jgi:lipid-binding SYLF domain-containing protein
VRAALRRHWSQRSLSRTKNWSKSVDAILRGTVTLGVDVSTTFAIGSRAEVDGYQPQLRISSASREPLGLFLGVSVEGAALTIRDTLNVGYYGAGIRSDDIFVKRDVSNPHAAELRAMLAKTSRKK